MNQGSGQNFGAFGDRLRFESETFVYDGRAYPYAEVRGLEFKQKTYAGRQETGNKLLYESYLKLVFASGRRMALKTEGGIAKYVRTHDKTVHDSMAKAAEWLAAYTFNARMDAYEADFKAHKQLNWGNYQISAEGGLFYRHAFCLSIRDENVRCMLYPFHLTCLRRPKVWWKRMLGALLKRSEVLDLRRDRDCFLYFMERRLGMRWPSETQRIYRGVAADGSSAQAKAEPKVESAAPRTESSQGAPRQEESAPPPPPPPRAKTMPSYPQHLATLGLGPDVKWDVVRVTYRQLARKHHPDLVRGRGASESAVKHAEEVLKNINEAYGWLEDFYKLKPK